MSIDYSKLQCAAKIFELKINDFGTVPQKFEYYSQSTEYVWNRQQPDEADDDLCFVIVLNESFNNISDYLISNRGLLIS